MGGLDTAPIGQQIQKNGYDLLGDLLYVRYGSTSGYGATFTYAALQRKTSETSTGAGYSRTMGSGYDLAGNRIRLTYPDGAYIQYTYDPLNRMKQVQQNGSTVMADTAMTAWAGRWASRETTATIRAVRHEDGHPANPAPPKPETL